MDVNKGPAGHEKSIEDYLFSGYQPNPLSEPTFDSDQQFARPIEDEDVFGSLDCDQPSNSEAPNQPLTVSQKRERLKELARGLKPKELATDCGKDGTIEFDIQIEKSQPPSKAKLIFERAASRRVKDKYGLYKGQKLYWDRYHDYLLENLSATKRKHWDSFQFTADRYNDEEELIEGYEDEGEGEETSEKHEGIDAIENGEESNYDDDEECEDEECEYEEAEERGDDNDLEEDDCPDDQMHADVEFINDNEDDVDDDEIVDEEDVEEGGEDSDEMSEQEDLEDEVVGELVDKNRKVSSKPSQAELKKLFPGRSKWIDDDDDDEDDGENADDNANGTAEEPNGEDLERKSDHEDFESESDFDEDSNTNWID